MPRQILDSIIEIILYMFIIIGIFMVGAQIENTFRKNNTYSNKLWDGWNVLFWKLVNNVYYIFLKGFITRGDHQNFTLSKKRHRSISHTIPEIMPFKTIHFEYYINTALIFI